MTRATNDSSHSETISDADESDTSDTVAGQKVETIVDVTDDRIPEGAAINTLLVGIISGSIIIHFAITCTDDIGSSTFGTNVIVVSDTFFRWCHAAAKVIVGPVARCSTPKPSPPHGRSDPI